MSDLASDNAEVKPKPWIWNECYYEVTVNLLAGKYLGDIVSPDEAVALFHDEANVIRLLKLNAMKLCENSAVSVDTVGEVAPVIPDISIPLTDEQIAGMTREQLAEHGIAVNERKPIPMERSNNVIALGDTVKAD